MKQRVLYADKIPLVPPYAPKSTRLKAAHQAASESLVAGGLVTLREAGRFLAISRATLYRLMTARTLPSAKIGKGRHIPRSALVRFAARSLDASMAPRDDEPPMRPKRATSRALGERIDELYVASMRCSGIERTT